MKDVHIDTVVLTDEAGNKGAVPCYSTQFAAGADIVLPRDISISPHERVNWIDLAVGFYIPNGKAIMVLPRSSTSRKWGVACDTGLIDSDYRGKPIHCALINFTDDTVIIKKGTRVVQVICIDVYNVTSWPRLNVERDANHGSGSTGD